MRDHHPVYRDPEAGFYALTRFEDVQAAAGDHATFSSLVQEADELLPQMIYMDPPRQTALRKLVSRAFTPRRVAAMEEQIRAGARALTDDIAARGRCEFQHEYAAVIPSLVVAAMIGLDDEYIVPMRTWTEAFIAINATGGYGDAAERIYAMFAELLEERRRRPRDDMMTALTTAEIDGRRLGDDELLGFCLLLVLGGNDTTASLLGSGTVLLTAHPDQRDLLLREPARWPAAVEEINRVESPTQALPRTTTRDVELHGVHIPAGSRVMLVWGAANHDDREFPEPERFDITRTATRHLAFGHGTHFCMGAGLARLEARVAFEEWHARFPAYELDGEPRRYTSIWARAYEHIPLRLA
jgi:cytochrome P450